MANESLVKLLSAPGIQRDGTFLSSLRYTDGEWVRFYRGYPKKIGGYTRMESADSIDGTIRNVFIYPNKFNFLAYCFTGYEQSAMVSSNSGVSSGVKYEMTADGTPMGEFIWTVDTMFDAFGSGSSVIVAHPGDNVSNMDNGRQTPVFIKEASDTATNFEPIVLSDATSTTGTMLVDSQTLTLASATGFSTGELVRVSGAGTPLRATITAINGLVVTLSARARFAVAGVTVDAPLITTTGTMSAGSYDVTVASTLTMEVGMDITVNGAGGEDMFATITNLAGVTATLDVKSQFAVAVVAVDHVLGTDGGIVILGQYLVKYGSNGLIAHCNINSPRQFNSGDANEANIVGTKIVKGLSMRSANGSATSGLLWSTDSVIRMTNTGGAGVFKYDVLSSQSSLLSSSAIIEYDGRFYWPGVDRFLMYSGSIQEVPNDYNLNYFFDNLNFAQRQKIWATKVPRFGEIWWFYPSGRSVECDRAIILNVRYNIWYDVEIDRTAGYYSQVFRYPIWTDGTYLWFHEKGKDKIQGGVSLAISSGFTTKYFSLAQGSGPESAQGQDQWIESNRIELDLVQVGTMSMHLLTKEYSRSEEVLDSQYIFEPDDTIIDIRTQARYARFQFISNDANGDYELGCSLLSVTPGDVRQ